MAKFYVLCDDDCRYEGMTKEEILTAIEQALEQGYVSDPDGAVFSKIKEVRAGASAQMWVGTEAEFNAISPAPTYGRALVRVGSDGVLYLCSNDSSLDWIIQAIQEGVYTKAEVEQRLEDYYNKDEVDEMIANIDFTIDNTVTSTGTNAVSGKAVADYVAAQIAAIADYEAVSF